MLIRQGDSRDSGADRRLAFTLAAVAGGLNAAAFDAVGFFSANMTGNVSSLSRLLALGQWRQGFGYLLIVATFVFGAMVSTLAIGAGLRRGAVTIYAQVVIAEAVLLAILGITENCFDRTSAIPSLIIGLSFLMGMQNAIVTHISDARVRTTHVSGMATDIGIGIARMIDIARGKDNGAQREAITTKLRLHVGTVAWFLAGGIPGVLLYLFIGDLAFAAGSIPLLLIALPTVARHRPGIA